MADAPQLTQLSEDDEAQFQKDYAAYSKATGMNPNPGERRHYYDYRGLWKEEGKLPGPGEHGDSRFKLPGHPRTYVDEKTGKGSKKPKAGYINTTVENKAKGGKVSASSRGDGCAVRGKTRGRIL